MSLDLHKTALQIGDMASQLKARQSDWEARLQKALATLAGAEASAIEQKRLDSKGKVTWLVPGLLEGIGGRHLPPPLPPDFCVLAVDGSHIDVDRHIAARCYLINIGGCRLIYGFYPDAHLFSKPRLYADEEDLVLRDPESSTREQIVEGAVLGFKRAVEEIRALAQLVEESPPDIPTLALVDGSLIMVGLVGQGYPDFVREAVLRDGLLRAMDDLRRTAQTRTVALASYISLPRSTEVVNALRLEVCPYEPADCDYLCSSVIPGQRPCDSVGGILDRDLLQHVLATGERSSVFVSTSSIVERYYGPHQVHFFYVNVGEEMARVEVPVWVAQDDGLLGLTHGLVVDQCRRGQGYPVAIMEAHEQAVVSGADRERFHELVDNALSTQRVFVYSSAKSRSKRLRWM